MSTSSTGPTDDAAVQHGRRLGFARASYRGRMVGLALGFVTLGCAMWQHGAPWWFWVGPALHGFVWPHIGWRLARRAADPHAAERRNMVLDHLAGGAWMVAIGFSPLPSLLMLSMMCMDSAIAAGARQLLRGLLAHAAGIGLGVLAFGWHWQPATTMLDVLACAPLLLLHPAAVGITAHRLLAKLQAQREHLARLGRHDALSGLFNRAHWMLLVEAEFQRFRRGGPVATLVLVDIDHFKRINDTRGHAAGDEAIQRFAALLRLGLRSIDMPARYGGEEFGVLLPGTDATQAREVMERLRASLHRHPLLDDRAVTASFGVVALDRHVRDAADWIQRADRLLYRAKHLGRDRVVVAGDPMDNGAEAPPSSFMGSRFGQWPEAAAAPRPVSERTR